MACAHLVVTNTWGIINSFGLFQSHYTTTLSPARSPADISWIGSFQIFLLFFIGALTGRLTDAGYFRPVFSIGAALQILGIFTSSFAEQSYTYLFLSQGIAMGFGMGCMFCPTMAIISTYFAKRRSLAIGIVACGSATGGLIFPGMVRALLGRVGFAWTVRSVGLVQTVTLGISGLVIKPRVHVRARNLNSGSGSSSWLDLPAFKEGEYTLYTIGSFMCYLGVFFGFYYVAEFARRHVGMSYDDSLNLLLVINGVGSVGRLVPNYLADRFGPITVFAPTAAMAGICVLCWMAVDSVAGLYVWVVFYGFAAGGVQSLFPAGLSSLTADPGKAGVRMGMVFSIDSFATLVGPPIAGVLISQGAGSYWAAQVYAGVCMLAGAAFMVAARMVKVRRLGKGWKVKV